MDGQRIRTKSRNSWTFISDSQSPQSASTGDILALRRALDDRRDGVFPRARLSHLARHGLPFFGGAGSFGAPTRKPCGPAATMNRANRGTGKSPLHKQGAPPPATDKSYGDNS